MKKYIKNLFCAFFMAAGITLASTAISAYAEEASVTYEANADKYIFAPGTNDSPTDLFPNFKNVMPGDTLTQKITIKNDASSKVKAKIYMRSLGGMEEKEFLSQMNLHVVQETDTELFDAPADQTAGLTEWTLLGTLHPGGNVVLNVELQVPITMGNMFQDKIGKLQWQFKVEEIPYSSGSGGGGGGSSSGPSGGSTTGGPGATVIPDAPVPTTTILPFDVPLALPQTGTLWWLVPILATAGIGMCLGGMVKRRKNKEDEEI